MQLFSKCLAPGYRLGWAAPGRFTQAVARQKLTTTLGASAPVQLALADYLRRGGCDKHLRRLRQTLATRKARMIEAVGRPLPRPAPVPPSLKAAISSGWSCLWVATPWCCTAGHCSRASALRRGRFFCFTQFFPLPAAELTARNGMPGTEQGTGHPGTTGPYPVWGWSAFIGHLKHRWLSHRDRLLPFGADD